MNLEELTKLYLRDLDRLAKEISAYKNADVIWQKTGEVNNSAGNLCMHLTGNLQHFIGAILGKSGYVRDRNNEFNCVDVPLEEMLNEIEKAKTAIASTLTDMVPERLSETYPLEVFGFEMTIGYFLMHLNGHLNYHLGQISYHRRILDQ